MKILQSNTGIVTNSEVLKVLGDRGCDGMVIGARSLASEKMVYAYLQEHSAGQVQAQQLRAVSAALQPFNLTRIEVLQLINLVPSTPVEVHLIVESCEERLSEEKIEELLQVVAQHLTKAVPEDQAMS